MYFFIQIFVPPLEPSVVMLIFSIRQKLGAQVVSKVWNTCVYHVLFVTWQFILAIINLSSLTSVHDTTFASADSCINQLIYEQHARKQFILACRPWSQNTTLKNHLRITLDIVVCYSMYFSQIRCKVKWVWHVYDWYIEST